MLIVEIRNVTLLLEIVFLLICNKYKIVDCKNIVIDYEIRRYVPKTVGNDTYTHTRRANSCRMQKLL